MSGRLRKPKIKDDCIWMRMYLDLDHACLNQQQQAKELRVSLGDMLKMLARWKRDGMIVMSCGLPFINIQRIRAVFPDFMEMWYGDALKSESTSDINARMEVRRAITEARVTREREYIRHAN